MISNKVILNFIILVVGFLSITTSVIGQKNSYIITGKVLDAERKPVANMAVYLAKPICTDCFDAILPSTFTDGEGIFYLSVNIAKEKKATIYIEQFYSDRLWSFVFPIESTPLKQFHEFSGIEFEIPKSKIIDLGEIYCYIKYKTFMIDYKKVFDGNEEMLKKTSEMTFDLEYKGFKIYENFRIDERRINRKEHLITITLPKGDWKMEIKSKDKKHKGKAVININDEVKVTYIN